RTFPAATPRAQLDHLIALGRLTGRDPAVLPLDVGDHRAVAATVGPG
ncbi:endonuclease, partial [Pseudonocardia sp. SID8383]|nr:endonuclease [Pseudonocardia sp. SID8383]